MGKLLRYTLLFMWGTALWGQSPSAFIKDLNLSVDTTEYRWPQDLRRFKMQNFLMFQYSDALTLAQVSFKNVTSTKGFRLMPSSDYAVVDSFSSGDEQQYKIRFSDLNNSDFLALKFKSKRGDGPQFQIPLLAVHPTYVAFYPKDDVLFIGEEKVFEIITNNPDNLVLEQRWQESEGIKYRFSRDGSRVLIHLSALQAGKQILNFSLQTKKPILKKGNLVFKLPATEQEFAVKTSRLAFLDVMQEDYTLEVGHNRAYEIQLEDHPFLAMGKTYRIENQEEKGGPLIAELYTKSKLNNNKVLCLLRIYAYHRKSEGYLYIKDGDKARFITNFNSNPKTEITRISLQREGKDWQEGAVVYPGENLTVKLEGKSLHLGEITFYGAAILKGDTLVRNANEAFFRLQIPMNLETRSIEIFQNGNSLGKSLQLRDYQKARSFDFIDIRLGLQRYQLNELAKPIFYDKSLADVLISFDPKKIDAIDGLHGKQYLKLKIKISNKSGALIELQEIENIVICPASNSPRFKFYNEKDCRYEDLNLNEVINSKTYDLPEWATIDLEFSHQKDKHGGEGFTKKVRIYLERKINYNIDVSFPAGLLILKAGENDFSNFGGISFAMMAQMSFYHPRKVAKLQPFKLGAGFIALDAFNFSENSDNRDVGLVFLGSLYPTSSENRLSFPIYMGYGYLLKQKKGFFLIGPGIRVRL